MLLPWKKTKINVNLSQNWKLDTYVKEARKGFFSCYSVCETMKDTK